MISFKRASRAPRGAPEQWPRKHAVTAISILFLITASVLLGAPATTAAPAPKNDHTIFVSDPLPPCSGEKPGMCPDSLHLQ